MLPFLRVLDDLGGATLASDINRFQEQACTVIAIFKLEQSGTPMNIH